MELEFIRWLRNRLPGDPRLRIGLGDDAAVIDWPSGPAAVVTVDMLTDGVDFVLEEVDPRRVGHKALGVNLSDLAAMAARPLAAFVALALPRRGGLELAKALYEGMLPLAQRHGVVLAGGDTNAWDGKLVVSVTLLGEATAAGSLTRSGARPGDRILVTGELGGSILGRHLDVQPRVDEALCLMSRYALRAGIDISDGLSLDLARLAEESGVGAAIETSRVPVAPAARRLAEQRGDGVSALEHALCDGEDFELILAAAPAEAERMLSDQPLPGVRLTDIGEFVPTPGLWQVDPKGTRLPLPPRGYLHGQS